MRCRSSKRLSARSDGGRRRVCECCGAGDTGARSAVEDLVCPELLAALPSSHGGQTCPSSLLLRLLAPFSWSCAEEAVDVEASGEASPSRACPREARRSGGRGLRFSNDVHPY